MKTLKIAMIQMKVEFHEVRKNIEHAAELVKDAASQGAQICVLPECMDLGWGTPKAATMAEPIPGKTSDALCKIASDYHVYLVCGISDRCGRCVFHRKHALSDTYPSWKNRDRYLCR